MAARALAASMYSSSSMYMAASDSRNMTSGSSNDRMRGLILARQKQMNSSFHGCASTSMPATTEAKCVIACSHSSMDGSLGTGLD